MTSKFVFGILLPAILVMVLALVWKQNFTSAPRSAAPVAAPPAPIPQQSAQDMPAPLPLAAVRAPAPAPMTEEERQEAIDDEKDRLFDLEMDRSPQSLSNVLADLNSPEKEIRMAAIDAAEQLHDTNAIPVLKAMAMTDQDTDEQMALLQAANFIATPEADITGGPPLTPDQIQAVQQQQAQRQAQMQEQGEGKAPNGPAGQDAPQPQ